MASTATQTYALHADGTVTNHSDDDVREVEVAA